MIGVPEVGQRDQAQVMIADHCMIARHRRATVPLQREVLIGAPSMFVGDEQLDAARRAHEQRPGPVLRALGAPA